MKSVSVGDMVKCRLAGVVLFFVVTGAVTVVIFPFRVLGRSVRIIGVTLVLLRERSG